MNPQPGTQVQEEVKIFSLAWHDQQIKQLESNLANSLIQVERINGALEILRQQREFVVKSEAPAESAIDETTGKA